MPGIWWGSLHHWQFSGTGQLGRGDLPGAGCRLPRVEKYDKRRETEGRIDEAQTLSTAALFINYSGLLYTCVPDRHAKSLALGKVHLKISVLPDSYSRPDPKIPLAYQSCGECSGRSCCEHPAAGCTGPPGHTWFRHARKKTEVAYR